jgi:signal transduction histidine kinase
MNSGIVAIDQDGLLAVLNGGAQRILGCPKADRSLGKPCREVLAGQPRVVELLFDTLAGRPAVSRAELLLEGTPEMSARTIGFTLTTVLDTCGDIRGAAMIFRDLTPIERMDEQQRLNERLAALGQMAAGLAHEIRNPLAGMQVIAGLLKRRLVDRPTESELLDQLTGELLRLADTVTDCLEFVRPMSPERGLADPVRLVEDGLATGLSRLEFDGTVERAFGAEIEPISADASALRDVVANLVVNAIQAMAGSNAGREKRLRVTVAEQTLEVPAGSPVANPGFSTVGREREVVITVSDTGPGVPEELRERVFYPFFTTKPSGSGVGLAIGQKVAASHGGALEIAPGVGRGATFQLRLHVEGAKPC